MIIVRPFMPGDSVLIDIQPSQQSEMALDLAEVQAASGVAFTVFESGTGRVLMVGGYVEPHPAYAALWSLLSGDKGSNFVRITKRLREWIAALPHNVVDTVVDMNSSAAKRWAVLIGLTPGPVLRGRLSSGGDALVCERFKI